MSSKLEQLQAMLAPVVNRSAMNAGASIHLSRATFPLLRVYIDHANGIPSTIVRSSVVRSAVCWMSRGPDQQRIHPRGVVAGHGSSFVHPRNSLPSTLASR